MTRARVLVVDDSVVVRRVLSELLSADPGIEVVGTAPNGRIALARLPQLAPDLVTLDLEMPEMDGLQTLRQLRPQYPTLPVLMLSRFTRRCTEASLDALALGATDYLALPEGGNLASTQQWLRDELLPRIKQLVVPSATPAPGRASRLGPVPRVEVLAIGASTGGPNALGTLLGQLPADFPVPIVIVQHMPAGFTRQLAERLSGQLALPVREGVGGAALEPGQVWIAPGDQHMTVGLEGRAVALRLDRSPPQNSCRPSVDVLLRSVASVYGAGALAVILTGMGQDGLRGCEAVRGVGGAVLAQDQATSVVWGMPGYVARAGLAHAVLPLADLGPEVATRARRSRSQSTLGSGVAVFPRK